MLKLLALLLYGVVSFGAGFFVCKNNMAGVVSAEKKINDVKDALK